MTHSDLIIQSFTFLGDELRKASMTGEKVSGENKLTNRFSSLTIDKSYNRNPWFIPDFVRFASMSWAEALREEKISGWISRYTPGQARGKEPAVAGIIMAGNIPMVGLHDLLCVLASGNHALIKLSASDDLLIPAILETLCAVNPGFRNQFTIVEGPLKNFNAVIATGSNNSSRYFDYYFGKYPHIIRKNRNSAAVLTGYETVEELQRLADDIFIYFGLGCRNVSKLYLPEGYKIEELLPCFESYSYLADLHKYRNNYDYQKALLLINRVPHLDNGFLLVKPDASLISPISVVNTSSYDSPETLNHQLAGIKEQIQCIVSCSNEIDGAVPPGRSQFPELWDYADGIDTMEFLMNL